VRVPLPGDRGVGSVVLNDGAAVDEQPHLADAAAAVGEAQVYRELAYLAQSVCAVLAGVVLMLLKLPKPATVQTFADGRPLAEIIRTRRFIVAVVCGLASYGMMNLMMTSAPPAMVMCNHSGCYKNTN
jgi:hypothetical protein